MPEFKVMSRKKTIEYANRENKETSAIISINDSYDMNARLNKNIKNNIKYILFLSFDDIEPVKEDTYWKKDEGLVIRQIVDSSNRVVCEERIYQLMTEEDADKVVAFVNQVYEKVDRIIVHCNAGISRSSSVCAAIMKYKTGDDSEIFNNSRYHPNKFCYNLVLNAFKKGENNEVL